MLEPIIIIKNIENTPRLLIEIWEKISYIALNISLKKKKKEDEVEEKQ